LELKHRGEALDVLKKGIINDDVEKLLTQTAADLIGEYK